jgi:hypothetical protein
MIHTKCFVVFFKPPVIHTLHDQELIFYLLWECTMLISILNLHAAAV